MALMKFREQNQVRWQGVRPAHDGTQRVGDATATAAAAQVLLVGAGKIFYLCTAMMGFSAIAAGWCDLAVNTAIPALWHRLLVDYVAAAASGITKSITFWPPLEIPAGYTIDVASGAAGLTVYGAVFGWEE